MNNAIEMTTVLCHLDLDLEVIYSGGSSIISHRYTHELVASLVLLEILIKT